MRVIGAGFGRTGTTSLKAALERLGYGPVYSLTEVFENPEHIEVWEAARAYTNRSSAGSEEIDWRRFLSSYEVAVDWPACSFYGELMEAFPEARVILTVRDPEPWYESMRATIYHLRKLTAGPLPVRALFRLAELFGPGAIRGVIGTARLADHIVWEDTFGGRFEDRTCAMEAFERQNEAVRRRVPQERLLVFDVRHGWAPLCDFLGVEIPNEPFPHLNETHEMRRRLLRLTALAAVPLVLAAVAGLAAVALFASRQAGSLPRYPRQ